MSHPIDSDWLKRWSLYQPKKIALKDADREESYTYRELFSIANGLVEYLQSLGVKKGDRVGVYANNHVETVFLLFALQRMGAILVPINFRLTAPETDYILQDSGCKILFYENTFDKIVKKLTSPLKTLSYAQLVGKAEVSKNYDQVFPFLGEFNKPCKILYTSGTTGFPKGVVITPKILFWNAVNTSLSLNLSSEDVTVNFSPFFHTGGWNVLLTPFLHRGGRVVLLSKFDSTRVLEICEQEKVSVFFGVPTTLSLMAQDKTFSSTDLSSVRFAVVGGEPMPKSAIKLWHNKGIAIRQGFGLTECGPNCFSLSEKDAISKMGSIGRPNFYVQTRVVDADNQDVNPGEIGELLLKGPMCMTEYWGNPKATEESFFEGWLRTGDLVKKDKDQYFYVVGRKKEMFISGGENVYPVEVETVIGQHPKIREVAVLGVSDPKWGEVGKAFVATHDMKPIKESELLNFCGTKLARYKIPKSFEFLQELPKGDSGKILKKQLIKNSVSSYHHQEMSL